MQQYLQLLHKVMDEGVEKGDRTGTGTKSIFGYQMRFDLQEGFPLLTTKRTAFRLIVSELLWFLKGDTNVRTLIEENNRIWDEWAFKQWVDSAEYDGPDMTDFGRRALKDDDFRTQYEEQVELKNTEISARYTASNGVLGSVRTASQSTKLQTSLIV